jgi:phosphate transport system permease protein
MATVVAPSATRASVEEALRGKRVDVRGRLFEIVLLLSLVISFAVLITLIVSIVSDAIPVFRERGLDFVTSETSAFDFRTGVKQGIVGSMILIGFVTVFALPLGIAAAVYLEEYARDTRLNRTLITNIRNLAGVPSIVYGILGLVVFVELLGSVTGPGSINGRTAIAGGLTLAVLVMPFIIIITMEALRAVPRGIREAAYGVGATRWEVVRSHVLPYAAPGVLTGCILSLARAFGETAPLLLVGAVTGYFSTGAANFFEQVRGPYTALPTLVFSWSRNPGDEWQANAAAAIVVLLVAILAVNAVAILLRNRYERKW